MARQALKTTSTAVYTTAEVLVFVAPSAPIIMPAPSAMEATLAVPVLRHTSPLSITSHAPHTITTTDICEISHLSPRFRLCISANTILDAWLQHWLSGSSHMSHCTQRHICTPTPTNNRRGPQKRLLKIGWLAHIAHPHTATFVALALVLSQRRMEAGGSSTTSLRLLTAASMILLT